MSHRHTSALLAILLLAPFQSGCGDAGDGGLPQTGVPDDDVGGDDADIGGSPDTAADLTPDAGVDADGDVSMDDASDVPDAADVRDAPDTGMLAYGFVAPPPGEVSPVLHPDTWRAHYRDDIAPYWTHADALGTPVGNYPTHRGMNGAATGPTTRRPRMISRQIHTYAMGYLITGAPALLEYAGAGMDWLYEHAFDADTGTCVAQLDASGNPSGNEARTAQDQAYCALGFAAWFFVTRDPRAESALLAIRDSLFDPALYWDEQNGRIRDALTDDLASEVDVEGDGGWELVAQLDAVNAFMLLVQPVLSDPERREQFLGDLRRLGATMVEHFHQDGTFWGVHNKLGAYGTRHADFGHGLKTFWMLLQIDKRLPDHPFRALLDAEMGPAIDRAYDAEFGRWAKRPVSATTVEYGSDWWVYAEADQTAATWNLRDHARTGALERSWGGWRRDYVDRTRDVREVVPSVDREGRWVWDWTDDDTAKCNAWKNGFHATEHAVVGTILGAHLTDTPVPLYFAPIVGASQLRAAPYLFHGTEVSQAPEPTRSVRGREHLPVTVTFHEIW